jgi:putative ABC transport system permease protein
MTLFTELREGLKISLAAIWANKLRSTLTTLGIIIGIVTVSLMATAIEGLNQAFLRSISALGSDVFYVERFPWETPRAWWTYRNRREFSIHDGEIIARESQHVLAVSAEASGTWPVKYEDKSSPSVWIVGNNHHSALVRQLVVKEGRFLSEAEVDGGRPVCVLGAEVAAKLFPHGSGVGRSIKVGNMTCEVVGVLDKFGAFLFGNMDNQVIIPITRFLSDFNRRPYIFFMVKVRDMKQMDEAREELRGVLRKLRRVAPGEEDDFAINQQDILVKSFRRVGGVIASVGLFITGLSLFVGGIGIMNIMFVAVAERTREIGIRKAIGAKRRTILLQFLIEAAGICLLGGALGLGVAWPVSVLLNQYFPTSLSPVVVGVALVVSAGTGIVAGFLPAWRAARMDPVDALRAE